MALATGLVVDDQEKPVSGARVVVGKDEDVTGADGRFSLGLTVLGEPSVAVFAEGFAKAERRLEIDDEGQASAGTVMLVKLSASGRIGAGGGVVSGGGLSVSVPAGAFSKEVALQAALIPVGDMLLDDLRLPRALPQPSGAALAPLFALSVDAGGAQPSKPLSVTLPSPLSLPAGTKVPVGRFDPQTGGWVDVGVALATATGLSFEVAHLSSFAGALPAVPDASARAPELDGLGRVPSPFLTGEPRVDPKTGALQVGVDLPSLVRRGDKLGLTLFHDSRTAKPVISAPVAVPDASAGEQLVVQANVAGEQKRSEVKVEGQASLAEPAVVVNDLARSDEKPWATGRHMVSSQVLREAQADLAASANDSFSNPRPGSPLPGVKAKVVLRASAIAPVAVDDRSASPFGAGWHLRGLTRLVQPWCSDSVATLAGGYETPAISFAPDEDLYLSQVEIEGLSLENLAMPPKLAWSGGRLYVGIDRDAGGDQGASVWMLEADGKATRVVGKPRSEGGQPGCSVAPEELHLFRLGGLAADPGGDGIVFASEDCILHLKTDGTLVSLAGGKGAGGLAPAPGVRADEVEFAEELMRMIAGKAPGVFALHDYAGGDLLLRDGVFEHLRTKVNHPHGHIGAIDAQGRFFYTVVASPCLYEHDDGLNDQPVFASCTQGVPSTLEDGPKETAKVGEIASLSFDDAGRMWFFDTTFKALRRLDVDGSVVTISGNRPGELSGVGGPAADASLGDDVLFEVATGAVEELAMLGGSTLLRFEPPPGAALSGLGAGDQSTLRKESNGKWTRVLSDGVKETYDADGLLEHRARPGDPGLRFVYGAWKQAPETQDCGKPAATPLLERITLGSETLFTFEWRGEQLTSVTDAAGRRTTMEHGNGRLSKIEPAGGGVFFDYDADGRVVERRSAGPTNSSVAWKYAYDNGRITSVTVPGRGVMSFESAEGAVAIPADATSAAGVARNVVAKAAKASLTMSSGGTATVTVGAKGLTVKSPAGDASELEMDAHGRLSRERRPDGTTLAFTRDSAGRVVELRNETSGERWSYQYDPQGRLYARTDPAGRRSTFSYDGEGRLVKRFDPDAAGVSFEWTSAGAAAGQPSAMVDALGRRTRYEYDDKGNLTRLTAPGGLVTVMTRDAVGRVVRLTEPTGLERRFAYDERDGVLEQSRGAPEDRLAVSYDRVIADGWQSEGSHVPDSAMMRAVDEEERVWRFDRDAAFQLTLSETPGDGRVQQTFDALGRLTRRDFADGSAEITEWNEDGRIERRAFTATAAGASVLFAYDELGRVASLTDPLVRETRRFAPGLGWDRVEVSASSPLPAVAGFTLTRARPAPSTETLTLGNTRYWLHAAFDGLIDSVERERADVQDSRAPLLTFGWNGARQLQTLTRANGVTTTRSYDEHGRVQHQDEAGAFGSVRVSWTYDEAGRPATRTTGGVTRTYAYDSDDRLASCSDTGEAFTWGPTGARASAGSDAYARDERGRLLSDGAYDYTWDAAGRRVGWTSKGAPTTDSGQLVYGPGGLLAEVRRGQALLASFRYDGSGRRIQKTTEEGSWHWGYLPDSDRPVRQVEPDGTVWHLVHAWQSAPFTAATTESGQARYVHLDPFERVLGVSDETGALHLVDEDCFGQRLGGEHPSGPGVGFHGMFWDEETGLYAAGPRYYDPRTGEFLSPDPAGLEAGSAPWGYGAGNPVLKADPGGRFPILIFGAIIAGAKIAYEIKKFATSAEAKRARQSYEDMTDLDDDDKLENAEKAHKNLHKASAKGGEAAVKSVKTAIEAVTDPASDPSDLVDAVADDAADALMEAVGEGADDPS